MTKSPKRTYNITSLQRGLKLLNLFAKAESGLTATQVARLSALPTSTVHRFLVNLESGGFLNSTSHGTFHLGMACFALGQAALGHLDIRGLSLPYLQELNQKTRETIHLTLLHDLSAVYVEKLDSPEPVRIYSRIGAAVPLHSTAVGKVMLAYIFFLTLSSCLRSLRQASQRMPKRKRTCEFLLIDSAFLILHSEF